MTLCVITFLHTIRDCADSKAPPVIAKMCVSVYWALCKRSEMVLESLVSIYSEWCGSREKRLAVSFHLDFSGKWDCVSRLSPREKEQEAERRGGSAKRCWEMWKWPLMVNEMDPRWAQLDVGHACLCLASAKTKPQQPTLQQDTDARKGSDTLNEKYRAVGAQIKGKVSKRNNYLWVFNQWKLNSFCLMKWWARVKTD